MRAKIAGNIPAYIIFGDASLRDMARKRPACLDSFLNVKGVGEMKCKKYGKTFISAIKDYCSEHSREMDIAATSETAYSQSSICEPQNHSKQNETKQLAFDMFEQKLSIKEVAKSTGRAESTTTQYLAEYIEQENINSPQPWVDEQTFAKVINAEKQVGRDKLKPIYDFLNSEIDYNQIRISIACLDDK